MPSPSSPSDSSFDRHEVAKALYIERGATDASTRCDLNAKLGELDLGQEILRRLNLQPGERVVDVACGAGQHLALFTEAVGPTGRAVGYDFNPDAIAKIPAHLESAVSPSDVVPLPDASIDALSCNYAIYYFDDLGKTLREWRRVLRPGGRLIVTGPARDTNAELYQFHKAATGGDPSDADLMALGFIEATVVPSLGAAGFAQATVETLTNPITFPSATLFLDYWIATSLYGRTPGASRAQGEQILEGEAGPRTITKRVTVLQARAV